MPARFRAAYSEPFDPLCNEDLCDARAVMVVRLGSRPADVVGQYCSRHGNAILKDLNS